MSYLKLNQLIVTKDGHEVYNETFHNRINIIRGHNSSGKSTISNFIFYALGGEFLNWLPEAASCDYVIAELQIDGRIITVKRDIDDKGRRPMSFFFGDIESSKKSLFEGWVIHPYNKTAQSESFSQVLFKILNFPEISTDNQETITINQILRLMYIDQLSNLDSLMRNEDFDSPTIRQAIGYLLLGTYDDALLKMQMEVKQKKKQLSDIDKQLDAIIDIFKNSPFEFSSEKILQEKQRTEQKLASVLEQLSKPPETKNTNSETAKELNSLRGQLVKIKQEFSTVAQNIDAINLDIIDSNDFIEVIQEKIDAVNDSLNARNTFKDIDITYCPVCLEKLHPVESLTQCHLCKKENDGTLANSKILRMKLELEMQLKESKALLEYKKTLVAEHTARLDQLKKDLKTSQLNYDLFINNSRSTTETFYDKLLEQKGKLTADIDFLDKQMQLFNSYEEYRIHKETLKAQIERLESSSSILEQQQRNKSQVAFVKIQEYTLQLLTGDGTYESMFKDGRRLEVSFWKNSFYLDGRNRFSASSMVLLKNCVRFAIFFASIELDFFRYPKFILCDNIEDKGMEEPRSKNFQKNIVQLAESEKFKDKDFQMIFSTSMINTDLDVSKYTVGDFYDDKNKTLKFN